MSDYESAHDLPTTPEALIKASQVLGSASMGVFTEYATLLTSESVYKSSLDLDIWPGNLQTIPYMDALMGSYESTTEEQRQQGIRVRCLAEEC